MRILIVGAGIAGLTLASLLKQRGIHPLIIEKQPAINHSGYMLGLYPLGSDVLHGLCCYEQFLKETIPMTNYASFDHLGRPLRQISANILSDHCGPYQGTTRDQLVSLLASRCTEIPIKFSCTIESLTQNDREVSVILSNQTTESFDLVIGADGIHSHVRKFILAKEEIDIFDTHWVGWVWWENGSKLNATIKEFWGQGNFFGAYPVPGAIGCIACLPFSEAAKALEGEGRKNMILKNFSNIYDLHPEFFSQFPEDNEDCYCWPLNDVRCKRWHKGRVLLLGDAACAFLPTAGIGATMAMESAAVLNDILSRTDAEFVPRSLEMFNTRRRKRVEKAQEASRQLAKYMCLSSPWQCKIRNWLIKNLPVQSMLKGILELFHEPI